MHKPLSKFPIDVEGLSVSFDGRPILWELDFSIEAGSITAIVGPNGAGKSTLLRALLGLVRIDKGKIAIQKNVAFVPQRCEIDWDFPITAFDVVLMGRYGKLGPLRWPRRADKEAALSMMRRLGIENLASRQIRKLSGGQQQRLFIARALLQSSDLIILDEPFAGIDMATEKSLIALFNELKSEGKTLLLVHHDLSTAKEYFDQILLLNRRIIAKGPPNQVLTAENLQRCYQIHGSLLEEVAKLSKETARGLSK
ncbi:MAG: metal ABC transporter ATP-binding protein [Candidatus Algichlamydia australiensis]|nr:metal ABC transporter ATP-binding protein [Chlamydiales bacterium]